HGAVVDHLEHAVAGEVRDLHGMDEREIGALTRGHRDLELGVEVRPGDALLLEFDAGFLGELVDELVHHLAVGAGEAVPIGDGGLGLRGGVARAARQPGRARRGGGARDEGPTAHSRVSLAPDASLGADADHPSRAGQTVGAPLYPVKRLRPRVDSAPWHASASTSRGASARWTVGSSATSSSTSAAASTAASTRKAPRSATRGASARTCWRRCGRCGCRSCAGPAATSSAAITGSTEWGRRISAPRAGSPPGTRRNRTGSALSTSSRTDARSAPSPSSA